MTVHAFGVDRRTDPTPVDRRVIFRVDGPSLISARLSGVNAGKVRMCLSRDGANIERECIIVRGGSLSRAVFDAGRSDWIVSLIGVSETVAQFATLDLTFNSLSPELRLDSFRFNGTSDPHNNGFEVVFGPDDAAGDFRIRAEFSDGNLHPWHLRVAPDDAPGFDQNGGPSFSVDVTTAIDSGTVYSVLFESPELSAAVLLDNVSLTWP